MVAQFRNAQEVPSGCHAENVQMLLSSDFITGNSENADGDDHKQIEGRRADNCIWSQITGFEAFSHHLQPNIYLYSILLTYNNKLGIK